MSVSFCKFLWSYSEGEIILYKDHEKGWIPSNNQLSNRISRDLKRHEFKFLSPVTVYSHLQACGIINNHGSDCECYKKSSR
ncbi:MAG: DNA-3-methyladenine glycosylase I [Alphaproteobacteria bacterium]|nr:DNA-3-methyladenine glycosylase I [Alphaproteobacteria bacterium]